MADPTLLVPGKADARNMEPLWNKGNSAIRTVDNTTIVFFEGSTFGKSFSIDAFDITAPTTSN